MQNQKRQREASLRHQKSLKSRSQWFERVVWGIFLSLVAAESVLVGSGIYRFVKDCLVGTIPSPTMGNPLSVILMVAVVSSAVRSLSSDSFVNRKHSKSQFFFDAIFIVALTFFVLLFIF
ncbi:hypothetical protein ACTNDZ_12385 [Selenomonas montiformis]|uniref:hypothetical protein n=1 Tax=Selenomonas montiformis TaxID=2652285 RepID=UPI003F8CA39A